MAFHLPRYGGEHAGGLDLPCPSCGEYALRAEVHLRDVALDVTFPGEGTVAVKLRHFGSRIFAIGCESCGDEIDPEDSDTGERIEGHLDEHVRLAIDQPDPWEQPPPWLPGTTSAR